MINEDHSEIRNHISISIAYPANHSLVGVIPLYNGITELFNHTKTHWDNIGGREKKWSNFKIATSINEIVCSSIKIGFAAENDVVWLRR